MARAEGRRERQASQPAVDTPSTRAMVAMAKKAWFALMNWKTRMGSPRSPVRTRLLPLPRYRAPGAVAGSHAADGSAPRARRWSGPPVGGLHRDRPVAPSSRSPGQSVRIRATTPPVFAQIGPDQPSVAGTPAHRVGDSSASMAPPSQVERCPPNRVNSTVPLGEFPVEVLATEQDLERPPAADDARQTGRGATPGHGGEPALELPQHGPLLTREPDVGGEGELAARTASSAPQSADRHRPRPAEPDQHVRPVGERGGRRRQRVVRRAVGRDVEMGEEVVPVGTVEDDDGRPVVLLDLGEQRIELDGHHRSMRLIGGLSKVTRHSDGVDLSRLKRVYAIRAVPFEGELLMLFSIVRHQPRNGLGGDDRRDRGRAYVASKCSKHLNGQRSAWRLLRMRAPTVLRPVANLIFRSDRPQPFPQGSGERREPSVLSSRGRQDATIFGDVVRRYVGQVDPHLFLGNLGRSTHFLQDPRDHPALLLLASTIPYVAANPHLAGRRQLTGDVVTTGCDVVEDHLNKISRCPGFFMMDGGDALDDFDFLGRRQPPRGSRASVGWHLIPRL